eukprot:TRINITY_DN5817_c0_g1_i1.p1 TRINITY_DN5817_c0_g1~~TRINITY_DN5817_c0_g1_i1.p1  ORF type:complete len:169 (+),score=0.53 TRINITY_DN5817_c0_g1_i1:57-563(+)
MSDQPYLLSAGVFLSDDNGGSSAVETAANMAPNESACPSLGFKQRVIGFAICSVIGILFSVIGGILAFSNLIGFAVCYTFGNFAAIGATMFIIGPKKQIKGMFKKSSSRSYDYIHSFYDSNSCYRFRYVSPIPCTFVRYHSSACIYMVFSELYSIRKNSRQKMFWEIV